MPDVKLKLEKVSQQFNGQMVLSPTDFEIKDGEFISIVGPSGCGKSTLFNIISGILPPSEGYVLLDNRDITAETGYVGYMLQKDLLLPWMSVIDNIMLGLTVKGKKDQQLKKEFTQLAIRYGLGDFIYHYPSALSGGMKQRVALMRTLAMQTDVILLDEPFGALDAQTRLEMQQWLLKVWAEHRRTVVFVTHDIDEAIFLSDRIVVMTPRPGKIETVLQVGIDRPRSLSCLTSTEFNRLKQAIFRIISPQYV
jgi:ABC-type nitrate/sulfonate/bicarbonate transport system ATPase subunit